MNKSSLEACARVVLLALFASPPALVRAQTPPDSSSTAADAGEPTATSTVTTDVTAGESDTEEPRRKWVKFNEFDGPYTTLRLGFGFLTDFASYQQDDNSEAHFDMPDDIGIRDFRLLFSGKAKTERPISWSAGLMYDGADKEWRLRQTGVMIGIPEAKSRVFIGRTKEGYSMVKVMTGYHPWAMERPPAEDAFIPILADGVKWMYHNPERKTFFSLGYFMDALSEEEKFSTYDQQVVGRFGIQPLLSDEDKEVLHLAAMFRYGEPDEGFLQTRSRPETNLSPYFLDTGKIEADLATTVGVEGWYRKGSWLFGGEYNWLEVEALTGGSPVFHGGDTVVAWLITGETRPYNASGGYFGPVSPDHSIYEGGLGAFEAVLRFSYSDFDDLTYDGGEFWRVTPMLHWHLSDHIRLEFVYGYGKLDRFDVTGTTQFYQARIQFAL